jgi:SAM-dependent methyltransferase
MVFNIERGTLDADYAQQRVEEPHLVFRYRVRARVVVSMVRKHVSRRPLRLLDLGCAEGRTLLEIRNLLGDGEYTGVEYSHNLLECAPQMPESIRLMHGNATCLPEDIEEGSHDVVIALALLEHIEEPASAVREACRVLRRGGIFIATSPVPLWDHISEKLGLLKDVNHVADMDRERMHEAILSAGLHFVEYHKFMWAPVGFLPYLKIPVGADFSLSVDRLVSFVPFLNRLFVNQCIVARKMT